jgi:hypothetical protein
MNGNENEKDRRKHALRSCMIMVYAMFYEDFHARCISMHIFLDGTWNIYIPL